MTICHSASLTGFNLLPLDRVIGRLPPTAGITLALSESGHIVDRTTMEYLHQLREESVQADRPFVIQGMDRFHPFASHPFATRMQDIRLTREPAAPYRTRGRHGEAGAAARPPVRACHRATLNGTTSSTCGAAPTARNGM
jgi:hypothetical protein